MAAFMMGEANRGREMMVFDWDKAAKIIAERQPQSASAGLQGDFEWTGGEIWNGGVIVPRDQTYTYLASTWATPILVIDDEEISCYRMESEVPGWHSGTYWPESARATLAEREKGSAS
ncbi:hypothetical protein [Massilia sp. TS11]|uniref:hypothetical protein n=1 Tax=Massilia sp. TS11 TaxID=2908003 RepID=UPI001EDB53BC|nr:hypothetical protein [Massilia sp. TS11]MCG2586535.1 hypothetical protein [Massilia sp. TS11]